MTSGVDSRLRERVVLFGPVDGESVFKDQRSLDELSRLVESAGGQEVGRLVQALHQPSPKTYFGSGKIEELRALVEGENADLAVFDRELSPAQGRNIEAALGVRVIDRSELIL
ncbi:MAG: GTPase HflX, partial [Planctomycetes bacterium]|nr:GTPase HflX [Planctomycetota bacterium]